MLIADGGVLCGACVQREIRLIVDATRPNGAADQQWQCMAVDANWEDPRLYCDHCGERIESAYADDDKDQGGPPRSLLAACGTWNRSAE